MILVDTNILIDVATRNPKWVAWSVSALEAAAIKGPLIANDVVYAEFSIGYDTIGQVDDFFERAGLQLQPIPRAAFFLAGKAHKTHRQRGGTRTGVLPDFFIGAHATVLGCSLLTRDAGRYRSYFPQLDLILPGGG